MSNNIGLLKAVEYLEQSKNELDNIRLESEETEDWNTVDEMNHFIERVQEVIDELSPDDDEVICDHAESCTQKLVVCEHQTPHDIKRIHSAMECTVFGSCSVAEIECKCVKVR